MIRKLELKKRMLARFQTILVTNGYHTNLGNNVHFDKGNKFDKNTTIALNFRFTDDDTETELSVYTKHRIEQDIQIDLVSNDPEQLFYLEADVDKAIGTDLKWKLANGTELAINTVKKPSFRDPVDHFGEKVCDLRKFITVTIRNNAWSEE